MTLASPGRCPASVVASPKHVGVDHDEEEARAIGMGDSKPTPEGHISHDRGKHTLTRRTCKDKMVHPANTACRGCSLGTHDTFHAKVLGQEDTRNQLPDEGQSSKRAPVPTGVQVDGCRVVDQMRSN